MKTLETSNSANIITVVAVAMVGLGGLLLVLCLTPDNFVSGYLPRHEVRVNKDTLYKFAIEKPIEYSGRVYIPGTQHKLLRKIGSLGFVTTLSEEGYKIYKTQYAKNNRVCPGTMISRYGKMNHFYPADKTMHTQLRNLKLKIGDRINVRGFLGILEEAKAKNMKIKINETDPRYLILTSLSVNGREYRSDSPEKLDFAMR